MTTLERNPATTDVRRPGDGPGPDRGHGLAYWAVSDCWNITRRTLTHYRRRPVAIVWQLGFPILSLLLYGYVFGSAMKVPGGGDYREFLMPGMFAMTMAMGFMNTAVAVVTDASGNAVELKNLRPDGTIGDPEAEAAEAAEAEADVEEADAEGDVESDDDAAKDA